MALGNTDSCLRSVLDNNSAAKEGLGQALLRLMEGFTDIEPQLPFGGPDGSADVLFKYAGQPGTAAVGFFNDVPTADTAKYRKKAVAKLQNDILGATARGRPVGVFAFFTNVRLTPANKLQMAQTAQQLGVVQPMIFGRSEIAAMLDAPRGMAARYQYLGIRMNESEQTSFFSEWGHDINKAIHAKINSIDSVLARLTFLAEAQAPLRHLTVRVRFRQGLDHTIEGQTTIRFILTSRHMPMEEKMIEMVARSRSGNPSRYDRSYRILPKDGDCWKHAGSFALKERHLDLLLDDMFIIHRSYNLRLIDLQMAHFTLNVSENIGGMIDGLAIYADNYLLADYSVKKPPSHIYTEEIRNDVLDPEGEEEFQINNAETPAIVLRKLNAKKLDFTILTPARFPWLHAHAEQIQNGDFDD